MHDDRLIKKIIDTLEVTAYAIRDDSSRHQRVSGAASHLRLVLVSPLFEGLNSLERHRRVHESIADEHLWSVSLKLLTPSELKKSGFTPEELLGAASICQSKSDQF